METNEDEAREASVIADKILKGEQLDDEADLESIYNSTRLRDIYNNRWWSPKLDQTYFSLYNYKAQKIAGGSQLLLSYGMRGDAYLVEK